MLTVAKVTGTAAAGYADYLEGRTAAGELGDYYLKDGERVEAPGRWVSGAEAVGSDPAQRVGGEQLRALMAVRRPVTGQPLRAVGASGEAVAALDATFSAPKSVSAAWALGDRDLRTRIEAAHELAVDRAVAYSVAQVPMARQRVGRDRVVHVKAREMVATSWRHTTARAVDGRPPDPQLHSHVLLHGAVREDGRLVAIDSKAWFVHRREIGAAYRTELAHELSRLGFRIERGTGRGSRYFEIAGMPQGLIERWSSRGRQVEQAIQERLARRRPDLAERVAVGGSGRDGVGGPLTAIQESERLPPREDRLLRVSTRSSKAPVTVGDLDREWESEGRRHGFRPEAVRSGEPLLVGPAGAPRIGEALTEFDATFTAREARAVALEQSAGARIDDALRPLAQLRAAGEVLPLVDGRLTTRAHRGMERATVAATRQVVTGVVEPIPASAVGYAADVLDRRLAVSGGALSGQQRRALETASADRQLTVIEGQAGTGKSTVLQAVALAHSRAGRQVLVTSTAAVAAERLADDLREVAVDAPAYSTAALTHAIADGRVRLSPATTIIHDEAALASTREQRELIGAVEERGARLILVGDPQQNQPVGAGGLWGAIERAADEHDAHVTLTQNLRARDPADQRDQALFRQGAHDAALRGYHERSRVHLAGDRREAEDQALDGAQRDRRAGRRTLVVVQTSNERLDELNARAQAIRIQEGELGVESIPLTQRPYGLHAGDQIQIRNSIRHPTHGQMRNGTEAEVVRVHAQLDAVVLRLPRGDELRLTRGQLERADARLAYVQHPFPAQGSTSETTHLIVGEHATREGTYVGLTRARDATHIYGSADAVDGGGDRLAAVSAVVGRSEPDMPSIATPLAHEREVKLRPDVDGLEAETVRESEREMARETDRDPGWEL